jgi:uncharacterized protein YyaL (SSP411 family)
MNELNHHSNLYLRQHGENPIHWKEWSERAWQLAKEENKLVIVSIGYSACHWCHVMEHECFEDDAVAQLTNAHYISIKVDREERPDIDQSYMSAVQLMGKPGGWPLNCICLPDGTPVFGGTYFPKNKWLQILTEINSLYLKQPETLSEYAEQIKQAIQEWDQTLTKKSFSYQLDHDTIQSWISGQDMRWGGTAGSPKFPMPPLIDAMLLYGSHYPLAQQWALNTLQKIEMGGIHDPIHGGFARYSVDGFWHIPHFEKMLYDNGQLMSSFSKAFFIQPLPEFALAIESIHQWLCSVQHADMGLFLSAQDADSDGEEGKYYCFSIQEIKDSSGSHYSQLDALHDFNNFCSWENDRYVLRRKMTLSDWALEIEISLDQAVDILKTFYRNLAAIAKERNAPAKDTKILTSWNAYANMGYMDASYHFPEYLEHAVQHFDNMSAHLSENGQWKQGRYEGQFLPRLLADALANVQQAAIALFSRTTDIKYYHCALQCIEQLEAFFDSNDNLYFLGNGSDVFVQKKEITDSVHPSINAIICENLYLLGILEGQNQWVERSKNMMAQVSEVGQHPAYSAKWLQQWIYRQHGAIAIACHASAEEINILRHWGIKVIELNQPSEVNALKGKYHNEKQFHLCTFDSCSTPFKDLDSLHLYWLSLSQA